MPEKFEKKKFVFNFRSLSLKPFVTRSTVFLEPPHPQLRNLRGGPLNLHPSFKGPWVVRDKRKLKKSKNGKMRWSGLRRRPHLTHPWRAPHCQSLADVRSASSMGIGRIPKASYSVLPSEYLLEATFSEPPSQEPFSENTLFPPKAHCKTRSKSPSQNLLQSPSENPF